MPTVLIDQGFRFFFYSNEGTEPPHIHVEHQDATAKFWLTPATLASSKRMSATQLAKAKAIVEANSAMFMERWNEHHQST